MPKNTVYVGRPTMWGNPFKVGELNNNYYLFAANEEQAVAFFKKYTSFTGANKEMLIKELGGKNLACWCPLDKPCHADVLLEIANAVK